MTARTIVGIDCATEAKKVGLAKGILIDDRLQIVDLRCGETRSRLLDTVFSWIQNERQVLLALDAPLGWPSTLRSALIRHEAGVPIVDDAELLFRRETDRVITQGWRKRPLDVGADRIARTAHSALKLLGELAALVGGVIPLAWDCAHPGRLSAVEVYPAATLSGRGIRSSQYKEVKDREVRKRIIEKLSEHVVFKVETQLLVDDADVLDAVVCTIAGADFLCGQALQPVDRALARVEGWIWAKPPAS